MSAKDWFEKDYYKILGVAKDASQAQIKKAFRKIARENHPDQHPGDHKAEQRFKAASEAHAVLSDPEKRRKYDEQRHLFGAGGFKFQRPAGAGSAGMNPEDLFRTMSDAGFGDLFGGLFGQGGQARRAQGRNPRRGADLEGSVTIGFQEAVDGITVGVQTMSEEACTACHGTGAKSGTSPKVCPSCQGSGVQRADGGGVFTFSEPCSACAGRGLIVEDPCASCAGTGQAKAARTIQVRIPAGVQDGQKLRIKGRGMPGENGGPTGDLFVKVQVRKHQVFGRDGNNLTINLPVTFAEAALGAEISVPTLGGSPVKLRIPAGTPNGRVLRVRGRGISASGATGDLLVTIAVQIPTRLSADAQEALRNYARVANEPDPRAGLLAGA